MAAKTSTSFGDFLSSPRNQRRLFIVSIGVFVVGLGAFLAVVVFRGTGNRFTDTFSNQPAKLAKPDPKAPLQPQEIAIARKFIKTAVARQDLGAAYAIVHPDLRGMMTKKQWETGDIPVISYHPQNADTAKFIVDYSNQRSALLEVDLVAKPGTETRPHLLFFIGLKRQGDRAKGRWLVSYWEPHWRPPIPMAPG
ncbi:MAG TPA: hypothetical protein VI408_13190 [Gaiellaceae bacterium]